MHNFYIFTTRYKTYTIMKKVAISFLSFLVIICVQSCQDHLEVETPVTRSYQQDVEILNEFVDINKTTHQYFINPNKRHSALSYITNADVEELNAVNPANLDLFEKSLRQVNSLAGQSLSSHDADYIVMIANGDIYISRTKSNSPVELKRNTSSNSNYQSILASVRVADEREQYSVYGNEIETSIELNPQFYQNAGWSFGVTCEVGDRNNRETVRVLFCGVGFSTNLRFEWSLNESAEQNTTWDFGVTGGLTNHSPTIGRINFLHL